MPTPRVELIGRCVKQPKLGTDKNGKPYMFVRIACSDSRKDEQGNWATDREMFVNVQLFGADTGMRIPDVGDTVRTFGRIYVQEDTHDGKIYHNVLCDAEFVKSWPKKQQQDGWGNTTAQPQDSTWGNNQNTQANEARDPWGSAPAAPPAAEDEPPF